MSPGSHANVTGSNLQALNFASDGEFPHSLTWWCAPFDERRLVVTSNSTAATVSVVAIQMLIRPGRWREMFGLLSDVGSDFESTSDSEP